MPENDLLTWADKQTLSGAFGINPSITTDGVPAIGWYIGKLDVNAGAKKITLTESNGAHRTWTNTTDAGEWTEWVLQANATPPQEYALPLAEGFTALSDGTKYCKTQENIVIVNIRCKANSSLSPSGNTITIGNLPSGFRPSGFVSTGAVFDTNDLGGKYVGGITVTQDGKVNANQQNNSWQFCYATIIFVAT